MGEGSSHCGSWELSVPGAAGVWLPWGPQCHFGNRLTEDAHGRSFLRGCLGAVCTFVSNHFPSFQTQPGPTIRKGTPLASYFGKFDILYAPSGLHSYLLIGMIFLIIGSTLKVCCSNKTVPSICIACYSLQSRV